MEGGGGANVSVKTTFIHTSRDQCRGKRRFHVSSKIQNQLIDMLDLAFSFLNMLVLEITLK